MGRWLCGKAGVRACSGQGIRLQQSLLGAVDKSATIPLDLGMYIQPVITHILTQAYCLDGVGRVVLTGGTGTHLVLRVWPEAGLPLLPSVMIGVVPRVAWCTGGTNGRYTSIIRLCCPRVRCKV